MAAARKTLDLPYQGGVVPARSDRPNVSDGHAIFGEPAALEIGRAARRETPALGACRTGAPPGAKRFGRGIRATPALARLPGSHTTILPSPNAEKKKS
ncbi:hypothetical protein NDU88_005521 [Pleurodeles waltl]|uniref:Uncharacterized protein n=1 Tax=Pleurodeles waltl TaxID=8319 RepID=A0AAV7WXA2_PLEWA|nr:hypothetical protein NDU88_005521 [Pleurodeles waltl]